MVFPVLPEFSMAVNKQVKGSEIFNKSETSKDKGKETGKKQGVDESVHKKRTVTENKIENSMTLQLEDESENFSGTMMT